MRLIKRNIERNRGRFSVSINKLRIRESVRMKANCVSGCSCSLCRVYSFEVSSEEYLRMRLSN